MNLIKQIKKEALKKISSIAYKLTDLENEMFPKLLKQR